MKMDENGKFYRGDAGPSFGDGVTPVNVALYNNANREACAAE